MPELYIAIVRKGDPPPWPDLANQDIARTDPLWNIAVLEDAMESGRAAVALRLKLTGRYDGITLIAETSVRNWLSATAAMRGAFPAEFAGTALDLTPDAQRDTLLEALGQIAQLAITALRTDGAHHKQWYLERILAAMELKIDGHEPGVAP